MKFPWNEDKFFALACVLCGVPVLLATYPPMVDVPQHAALIASLKSMLFGGDWAFSELFEIKPFTPYWLGYCIVMALSVPLGIALAMKVVVAASLGLFVWTAARFCLRMGVPSAWTWILLVLPYGFAFQWGFLNFIVAAPLGFLFLVKLLDLRDRSDWRTSFLIGIWLHCLFFAHILITGFFCVIGMLLLADPWSGWRVWVRRCLPIFSILPLTALWLVMSLLGSPSAGDSIIWRVDVQRFFEFLPGLVSAPDARTGQIIGLFVLCVPFFSGTKLKKSLAAYLPFGAYVIWMGVFPHYVGGTFFTYQRFGIFGLPLYFLCFAKADGEHRLPMMRIGLAIIAAMIIGWHGIRAMTFNAEVAGFQSVIEKTEPGKRMLMLPFNPTSQASEAPLLLHIAGWYQAEHGGLSEFNFARFWVSPIQYKDGKSKGIFWGFEWYPGRLDWEENNGDAFDYILIRHPASGFDWLNERSGGKIRRVANFGQWQLYEKNKPDG